MPLYSDKLITVTEFGKAIFGVHELKLDEICQIFSNEVIVICVFKNDGCREKVILVVFDDGGCIRYHKFYRYWPYFGTMKKIELSKCQRYLFLTGTNRGDCIYLGGDEGVYGYVGSVCLISDDNSLIFPTGYKYKRYHEDATDIPRRELKQSQKRYDWPTDITLLHNN